MEQIDQLKAMRDSAKERLEAAIAALEKSPDAKLMNSLTSLIDDLEESLGLKSGKKAPAAKTTATTHKKDDEVSDSGAAKAVEGAETEPFPTVETGAAKPFAKQGDSDISLEDSLEAELLGTDLGKS